MRVIFIRHGSTEPGRNGKSDAARELTEAGKEEIRTTAKALRKIGVSLERVFTSPLVRAIQTARILAKVHRSAEPEKAGFLAPPGHVAELRTTLRNCLEKGVSTVGLVGHAPSLNELLSETVVGRPDIGVSLSKAGAACVELSPDENGGRLGFRAACISCD